MDRMTLLRSFTLAVLLALAAIPALAQPVITNVTPGITSANTGATVDIFGSGFGASDDRVYFPGTNNWVNPDSWAAGYLRCTVPATWSGNVQVQSHGTGLLSNGFNHNISFSRTRQWSPASMTWWLNQNGAPGSTVDETLSAVAGGYDAWACASGIAANYQGTTSNTGDRRGDGINTLYWSNSGWPDPNVIAVCMSTYYPSTGNIAEFDIHFNSRDYTWSATGAAGAIDIQNTATHEQGHSIGLLDLYGTYDIPKTMYGYSGNGQVASRTLEPEDVEGAEYLYPHAGRANLVAGTPAGWSGPLVPRNGADATDTYAPLPSSLSGNGTTYLNAAQTNDGGDCATPYGGNAFYVDDVALWSSGWAGVWQPGVTLGLWRNLAMSVSGGRHTLKHFMDANADIVESNESDNLYQAQYAWSPYGLADQLPVTRAVPPTMGPFAAPNCDGFQFTGNWWGCVAVIPTMSGDDYDLQLFNDYVGSNAGYSTALRTSALGGTASDFVLVNGNVVGSGSTRWAGVDRYAAGSGGDFVICQSNQVGTVISPGTAYDTWATASGTITGNQIVKVYEVYLGSTTTTYTFALTNGSGTADLNISLYDAAVDYFAKSEYVASSQAVGGGTHESFNYAPSATGYYGLVVWKRDASDLGLTNNYTVKVGPALANLNAAVTPGGFSSPVVPRNQNNATPGNAVLTSTLDGNSNSTWLNWAIQQEGPNPVPGFGSRIYLDADQYLAWSAWDATGPASCQAINVGAVTIRGGRHQLTGYADYDAAIAESNESDNAWSGQWVWSPLVVAKNSPVVRSAPPTRGGFTQPNADGFQCAHLSNSAWVVSEAAANPGDDYDLYCYDDYSSSTAGFSNLRTVSNYGSNATDFVVGHWSGTPGTVYPAVVRFASGGGGGGFAFDQTDADLRGANSGPGVARFAGQTLGQNRLADVYEGWFDAGSTYNIVLTRRSGTADLAFEVFPGTAGGIYHRGGYAGISNSSSPACDTLAFTASASGWHPIVVFRPTGSDVAPLTYDLTWSARPMVDVPADGGRAALDFAGAVPNPVTGRSRLIFMLAGPGTARLALYDVNGRLVRLLAEGERGAGRHEVAWDGTGEDGARLRAGLYWARLEAGGKVLTKRVTVLH